MVGEESEVGEGIRYLDCLPDVTIGSIDGGKVSVGFPMLRGGWRQGSEFSSQRHRYSGKHLFTS